MNKCGWNPSPKYCKKHNPKWITPERQLDKLAAPIAEKISSIVEELIPEIANIIAPYATEHGGWYIALDELGMFPDKIHKIPPLPENSIDILEGRCPIHGKKRKKDGTFYKVKDTHTLTLIPRELISLNHFEMLLKSYGERHYPKEENPLRFTLFHSTVRKKYDKLPIEMSWWELMTKEPLPDTQDKSIEDQTKIINSLNKRVFLDYESPSVYGTIIAIFFHKIVTNENLYDSRGPVCNHLLAKKHIGFHYTRVRSKFFEDDPLIIGHFTSRGIELACWYRCYCIGMAVRRIFL